MVKQIIQYSTVPSQAFDGIVRHYDNALYELINDLKDTIDANDLDALAAYQIGSPYAVIVIKKDTDDFLEIINPIIITKEGVITPIESTAYYPGLTAKTKRYQKIKLMYEDRNGNQHFLTAEDDLAVTIQRKTDYLLGANFRVRMTKEDQALFDAKLENNTNNTTMDSCPTTSPTGSKLILNIITIALITGGIGSIFGLFINETLSNTLYIIENYLMLFILLSLGFYFFIARYEGKKYIHCTSCQTGNIIGTIFLQSVRLLLLFIANYFIFW